MYTQTHTTHTETHQQAQAHINTLILVVELRRRPCSPCVVHDARTTNRCARKWLATLGRNVWHNVRQDSVLANNLSTELQKYSEMFRNETGTNTLAHDNRDTPLPSYTATPREDENGKKHVHRTNHSKLPPPREQQGKQKAGKTAHGRTSPSASQHNVYYTRSVRTLL